MVMCGFIGACIGRLLSPFINDPNLDWRLGFLAGFDGLGIVSLVHVLLFQCGKNQDYLKPSVAFLMFVAVGMKCGHGHGIGWLTLTGIANGLVASSIAFTILGRLRRPTMNAC
jgi:hypothetical protein